MENDNTTRESVPYIVHESTLAKMERQVKRLFILCILIFLALIGTNAGWLIYESQFEEVVMTQEATTDGGGNATVSGVANGNINNYGESTTDNQDPEAENGRQ